MISKSETATEAPPPATPEELFARLDALGIRFESHHHRALFTVAESKELRGQLPGAHCKSLFLKDKKGVLWLVVALEDRRLDMKALGDIIGSARLSFASPARLMAHLGVAPGAVTPFALINQRDHRSGEPRVRVVLDAGMMEAALVNFHPLVNTATIAVTPADLLRFLSDCGSDTVTLDLTPATVDRSCQPVPK
jgi:Ala-tRNA(Pro) deacylase